MSDVELSIVIPVYTEEKNVEELHEKLIKVLSSLKKNYEIIFVDDGSTDKTFENLLRIHEKGEHVKLIQFRKNFGKATALSEGFKYAKGDIVITMDGDLQDDPEEIPNFLNKIDEGYDLVVGWKFPRKDPITKTLPSKIFNKLTANLTRVKIHDFNCGFKAYRKEVTENIEIYGELHRYIPALAHWRGYRIGEIKVKHHARKYGKSKYGSSRLVKGFLDLLTVKFLMSFTKKPLHLFGSVGLLFLSLGVLCGLYLLWTIFILNERIGDRPLTLLCVLLIILGVQFFFMGFLGELITSTSKTQNSDQNYIKKKL